MPTEQVKYNGLPGPQANPSTHISSEDLAYSTGCRKGGVENIILFEDA